VITPRESSVPPEAAIEAVAAAWLSLRDHGMSPDETAAFLRWLQQNPRHAEIYSQLDQVWRKFDRLSAPVAAASVSSRTISAMRQARARRRRVTKWIALGAAAALALAFFSVASLRHPEQVVATEVGAFRKLDLPDGSVAQLNTDSAIDFSISAAERRVRVLRGEVFFNVAKDAARPFLVTAGPVVVRAVGTAFNVRHRPEAIEVLVTEGRVVLASEENENPASTAGPESFLAPDLFAGDRAVVTLPSAARAPVVSDTAVERVTPPAMQRALAWQERRLEFDSAALVDVVQEFNRYNREQLVIGDAALAARRFSGVFRADSYESLVRLLETDFGVTAERRGREIILRSGR
jgi:transmembrane sensor